METTILYSFDGHERKSKVKNDCHLFKKTTINLKK